MSKLPRVVSAAPRLKARAAEARRRQRRSVLQRGMWVAAAAVPLVALAWVMLFSSLFAVKRIVVSGEHRVTAAQLKAAASSATGRPLARVDTSAIAHQVKELGAIASVSVTRSWPNTLHVAVVERAPAVAIADNGSWDLLDASGVQFATVSTLPRGVLRLEASPTDHDATAAALVVVRDLPPSLRAHVSLVRAPSAIEVALVLTDARVVVWGSASDSKAKAAAAVALLRLPGHVYDVSSPSVVTRR